MSTLKSDLQIQSEELYSYSSTQAQDLGSLATTGDGRYFRYAKMGATTGVPGQAFQGPASDATNFSPSGGLGVLAAATGAVSVTLSDSLTITANALAGGIMSVAVTPGQGYSYKVKSNTAVSAATGCVVTLEDPIQVALTTSSKVVFSLNPYNGIVVSGTAPTNAIVGVPVVAIPPSNFGWIQTRGPASVLVGGTLEAGVAVGVNLANVTGALAAATGVIFSKAGSMTATGTSGEYDIVNLQLN